MPSYKLVNPVIKGTLNTTYKGKNGLDAAHKAYQSISKYVHNSMPEFFFTLEKTNNGKTEYNHFKVIEDRVGDEVSYEISKFKKVSTKDMNKFKKTYKEMTTYQRGGGDDYNISIDDSSSDDLWRSNTLRKNQNVISFYLYYPRLYHVRRLFVPTFVTTLSPYVVFW